MRTRQADELLRKLGGDPPSLALLKIGRDTKVELPLRLHALAAAAPYFSPKMGASPPPRFLTGKPDLGRLTDPESAVVFVASVVETARIGELDEVWSRIFIDAADVFVRLYDKLHLQVEVERHRELERQAETVEP
jgi:hypothetical protein